MARIGAETAAQSLRQLRERAGLSIEELARAAGYKHASGIQRYLDPGYAKAHFPLDLVRRLEPGLVGRGDPPITADELYGRLAGIPAPRAISHPGLSETQFSPVSPNIDPDRSPRILPFGDFPRDVPVYGVAAAGKKGDFAFNGETVDYIRRPLGIANRQGVFAIYAQGDSMSPWRGPGDPVYVDTARPPKVGDYVVVECVGRHGEPGAAFLKRLVAMSGDKIRLEQYNPPNDRIEIPRAAVKHIYRVIDWAELLGI